MGIICAVDDSPTARASIEYTLKSAGFEVLLGESGEDALKKYGGGQSAIDLFILDINMPGMNGIELIYEIRKIAKYKFTPILMLTTESQESMKLEGKKAGASGWFVKPFNPEQLVSIANRFVKQ